MGWQHKRDTFWTSIAKLLGHLVMSALVFVSVLTLGWAVSWYWSALLRVHPMDAQTTGMAEQFGKWLLYSDVALSMAVLLTGVVRFLIDLLED